MKYLNLVIVGVYKVEKITVGRIIIKKEKKERKVKK